MSKEACPKCGKVGALQSANTNSRLGVTSKRMCRCGVLYSYQNGKLLGYKLPEDYKGRQVEAQAIVEVKMGGP